MGARIQGIYQVDDLNLIEIDHLFFIRSYLELLAGAAGLQGSGGINPYGLQVSGFDGTNPRFIRVDTNGNLQIDIITENKLTPISGIASSSGNNLLITPAASKKLRIAYLSYNPNASVEVAFRFGAGGVLFLRNNVAVANSIIAKDFGDTKYVEGAVNEALNLNLSSAVDTIWNALYTEI